LVNPFGRAFDGGSRSYVPEYSAEYAVSNVVGFIKGKSAISIARTFRGKTKNFTGENFWARGFFVSTVGLDEEMVRNYIWEQERKEERYKQC
jgi:putative transposase